MAKTKKKKNNRKKNRLSAKKEKKQKRDKMKWMPYKIIFQVISPIHIGFFKKGNLETTRCYVTGRNIWGALTARITRELKSNDYKKIGEEVDNNLAFTYFYISDDKNKLVFPWDEKGNISNEFSWKYLNSYMSTSVNERNAKEGSLHEMEFIAPYTRDGKKVYLIGYIFEKNSAEKKFKKNWKEVLNKLSFGGERSYGWGRVKLLPLKSEETNNENLEIDIFNNKLKICLNEDRPSFKIKDNDILLAHTESKDDKFKCEGSLVPLVGRTTKNDNTQCNEINNSIAFWSPGSKIKNTSNNKDYKFKIIEKGLWKLWEDSKSQGLQ